MVYGQRRSFLRCRKFLLQSAVAIVLWGLALFWVSFAEYYEYCPDCWQVRRRYALNPLEQFDHGLTIAKIDEPSSSPWLKMHQWYREHYDTNDHQCREKFVWFAGWNYFSGPRGSHFMQRNRVFQNLSVKAFYKQWSPDILDRIYKNDPNLTFLILKNMADCHGNSLFSRANYEDLLLDVYDLQLESISPKYFHAKWERKLTTNLIHSGNPMPIVFPKAKAIVDKNKTTD